MRRLHPDPRDLPDITDVYGAYRLPERAGPHLRLNMVASVDGHVTDADGLTGSLGGEGDLTVFRVLRHLADAIVVGAGTVRAEDYGPMVVREDLRAVREADGRDRPAPIVVVTSRGDLDPHSRLFDAEVAPIIVTTEQCPEERAAMLTDAGGIVVVAGGMRVDLATAVRVLRDDHGLAHLLVEGGPILNGQLLDAELVDELCLTVTAALTGVGDERRVVTGLMHQRQLSLTAVAIHEPDLFLRYDIG